MNVWTPNKHDSPLLFSMAVIYKVSFHLCDYLILDQYNKLKECKVNEILSELYLYFFTKCNKTLSSKIYIKMIIKFVICILLLND